MRRPTQNADAPNRGDSGDPGTRVQEGSEPARGSGSASAHAEPTIAVVMSATRDRRTAAFM
jgi:hypothetical protein